MTTINNESEGNTVRLRPRDGDVRKDFYDCSLQHDFYLFSPYSIYDQVSPMKMVQALEGYSLLVHYISEMIAPCVAKVKAVFHKRIGDAGDSDKVASSDDAPSDYTLLNKLH